MRMTDAKGTLKRNPTLGRRVGPSRDITAVSTGGASGTKANAPAIPHMGLSTSRAGCFEIKGRAGSSCFPTRNRQDDYRLIRQLDDFTPRKDHNGNRNQRASLLAADTRKTNMPIKFKPPRNPGMVKHGITPVRPPSRALAHLLRKIFLYLRPSQTSDHPRPRVRIAELR
jgi:hypothetical protein